jgi:hypothetical protein
MAIRNDRREAKQLSDPVILHRNVQIPAGNAHVRVPRHVPWFGPSLASYSRVHRIPTLPNEQAARVRFAGRHPLQPHD